MAKHEDCLNHAAQSLELAGQTSDSAQWSNLLDLAEKWLELADRRYRAPKHSAGGLSEHPLVRRAFRGLK
jgi:hypothetical protein